MKTNKYIHILSAACIALGFTACVDENDWGVDKNHDRPFSPQGIDVTVGSISAVVEFDRLPSVDYYLLELSNDSLYQETISESSRVDTVRTSPYTLTGLSGETKYFLRMKAVSTLSTVTDSKWAYYEDDELRSFITDGEQILNSITAADLNETSIRLSWEAGLEVTHIDVALVGEDGEETALKTVTLTDENKEDGSCTIDGLQASTRYSFTIYNGTSKRGSRTASTTAAMPEGDYKYSLPESTTAISQELIDELAAQAQAAAGSSTYSVTIGIPAGLTLNVNGIDPENGNEASLTLPEGMSVTFFGLAGAEKAVLNFPKALEIGGTHAYIRFENVTIVDGGCQYLINQSAATTVGELSFDGCDINDMSRSLVRLQGSATKSISNIVINDCVVTNQGSGNYALLYFNNAAYTVSKIDITNSTFDTLLHSFCDARNANFDELNISDCTFYNVIGGSRYFLDARNLNVAVNITNTIFGKTGADSGVNGLRTDGAKTMVNVYKTSDCTFSSYNFDSDMGLTPATSAEVFADPDNGDFTVQVRELQNIGDPRWRP